MEQPDAYNVTMIATDDGHAWCNRAQLLLTKGDALAARNSLAAMLEVTRDPEVRKRLADTLRSLGAVQKVAVQSRT